MPPKTSRELLENFENANGLTPDQQWYRQAGGQRMLPTCIHNDIGGNPKYSSTYGRGSRLTHIGEELRREQKEILEAEKLAAAQAAQQSEYNQETPETKPEKNGSNTKLILAVLGLTTLGGAACYAISALTGKF